MQIPISAQGVDMEWRPGLTALVDALVLLLGYIQRIRAEAPHQYQRTHRTASWQKTPQQVFGRLLLAVPRVQLWESGSLSGRSWPNWSY